MTVKTKHGCTVTVEQLADVSKGDKSKTEQKGDDESINVRVIHAEDHRDPEPGEVINVDTEELEQESEPWNQEIEEDN